MLILVYKVLPITETRFKRKRDNTVGTTVPKMRPAKPNGASNAPPLLSITSRNPPLHPASTAIPSPQQAALHMPRPNPSQPPGQLGSLSQLPTLPSLSSQIGNGNSATPDALPFSPHETNATPQAEMRIIGATSLSHLVHSTSTLPVEHLHGYDTKYAQTFEMKSTGDGFIKVHVAPPSGASDYAGHFEAPSGLSAELVEQLVNRYLEGSATRFPILSRTDFLAATSLSPLLLYTICGVAAMTHEVPQQLLRTIKQLIAHAMRDDEVMNRSSLQTIQGLLLYSYAFELERGAAASRTWFCLGLAVRMAQDIGLHRETPGTSLFDLEQRRRIWAGCIVVDRWVSAR